MIVIENAFLKTPSAKIKIYVDGKAISIYSKKNQALNMQRYGKMIETNTTLQTKYDIL